MRTLRLLVSFFIIQLYLLFPTDAFARGGGGCVAEGTIIDTPTGPIPIEQIKEGDLVLSWNGTKLEGSKVAARVKVEPAELLEFNIRSTAGKVSKLVVTPEHPIAIADGVYQEAKSIKENSTILLREQQTITTGIIQRIVIRKTDKAAYNLLVEKNGTFIADNVLVHNKGCFLPGTPIVMADGRSKNIEDIKEGDQVLAFNENDSVVSTVVKSIITTESESYLKVQTDNVSLRVTPEHPFYVGNGTFKTIHSLKEGDTIFAFNGSHITPQVINKIKLVSEKVKVYNLQTDIPHTFLANGIAVHNKGGGCIAQGTLIETPLGKLPIEKVKVGDSITTWNGDRFEEAKVAAHLEVNPKSFIKMEILRPNTNEIMTLVITPEHPIAVENGIYQEARTIKKDAQILVHDENGTGIGRVKNIFQETPNRPAYNLLVDKNGTFIANDIIVHNKGCFLPQTPITLVGGSKRNIENIHLGDKVLAFNEDGSIVPTSVRNIVETESESYLDVLTDKIVVSVTPEHPFFVGDGTFKTIRTLREGDTIFAFDGNGLTPQIIKTIKEYHQKVKVYNLQTDAPHTFLANGIAVHNKGGGGFHSRGYHSGNTGPSRPMTKKEKIITAMGFSIYILGLIISVYVKNRNNNEELDYIFSRSNISPKAEATKKLLAFISKTDTIWAESALVEHVSAVFLKLQRCWQKREYSPMREELIGYLYNQHEKQLAGLRRNHEINLMIDLQILKVDIVNVRYTHKSENREFTALITAKTQDVYVDDRTQQRIRGDEGPRTFQEFWTFQLMNGKWLLRDIRQTGESNVLKEENFFEQFTDQQVERATGAAVTQTGAAAPWLSAADTTKATRTERLLNFLYETDKLWNKQEMLNLARSACTNLYMAMESLSITSELEAELIPSFLQQIKEELTNWQNTNTSVQYRNFCVREVEIVLVRNFNDNTKDEYVARVFGHAQTIVVSKGRETRHDEDVTPFEEFLTFARDNKRWRLKELMPSAEGKSLLKEENFDEDTTPQMMQWYYSKKRTV